MLKFRQSATKTLHRNCISQAVKAGMAHSTLKLCDPSLIQCFYTVEWVTGMTSGSQKYDNNNTDDKQNCWHQRNKCQEQDSRHTSNYEWSNLPVTTYLKLHQKQRTAVTAITACLVRNVRKISWAQRVSSLTLPACLENPSVTRVNNCSK